ncbi:flavin reductase family protein [Paraburkholderia sp.]|uniref:flavin reductase family protein n=1 Tax=Paraburkholderia sp. TaxID=1926495 RepID=UPI002D51DE15|nr:flavin reductase family protein [Paraburkholderia sp.]HZZ02651.1 flavin reductase family protein [Paraburkholderia sp.]
MKTASRYIEQTSATLGPAQFRRAMGKFATGVTVVTFEHEGKPAGMTANAFMSLSVDPPMILIAARSQSRFAQSVVEGDTFGVSFLDKEQEALSRHFGGQPDGTLPDPFEDACDVPLLRSALVRIVARVDAIHAGGDHHIYTADVLSVHESDGPPLLFYTGKYKALFALDPLHSWNDPSTHVGE